MRALWRVSRPFYAAAAASAQSAAFAPALRNVVPRGSARWIGLTAARWQGQGTTPVVAEKISESTATAAAAAAATPNEEADTPIVDLEDVGAETTKVLTIADVLSRREAELSQQGSAAPYFDQWESISGSHTIQDAIDMMVEYNIGSLIVTEENAGIVGIVTERDVMKKTSPRALAKDTEKPVKDIMSAQIMCIPSTTTIIDALATMTKEDIRHLAVINGEISNAVKKGSVPEEAMRCVLSIKDIVKAYAHYEAQKKKLQEPVQSGGLGDASVEGTAVATKSDGGPVTTKDASDATAASSTQPETSAAPAVPPVTAGSLLKKKHKKIRLILNTRVEDNITVAEAVEEMAKHNFGAVLVVDKDQRVLGIFTERDYLTKILYPKEDPSRIRVTDVSTKKLSCFQIEDSLEKCWTQAATLNFRHFPVIVAKSKDREKELAGILSIKDIVREISKGYETPSGFRLMEFFKSKIAKEDTPPPPPAATATPQPAETKVVVKEEPGEKTPSSPETPEKQELAAKAGAAEFGTKKSE